MNALPDHSQARQVQVAPRYGRPSLAACRPTARAIVSRSAARPGNFLADLSLPNKSKALAWGRTTTEPSSRRDQVRHWRGFIVHHTFAEGPLSSTQLDSALGMSVAFCLKASLPSSTTTVTGSLGCRLPLRISSASGSSKYRSTARRMGRAP
jgi:hypothetical protein